MDPTTAQLVFGIVLIVIAIGLIYWINRRRFYRRSAAGVEMFSGYNTAIIVRFMERIGKWVAYALIIIGLLCIWTYSEIRKDEKKQEVQSELPVQR